jgi:hypothetical protein
MLGMNWRNLTCTYTWLESTLENSEGQKWASPVSEI